jgi:hypothetical protein
MATLIALGVMEGLVYGAALLIFFASRVEWHAAA